MKCAKRSSSSNASRCSWVADASSARGVPGERPRRSSSEAQISAPLIAAYREIAARASSRLVLKAPLKRPCIVSTSMKEIVREALALLLV
jgi:hypothetical protein